MYTFSFSIRALAFSFLLVPTISFVFPVFQVSPVHTRRRQIHFKATDPSLSNRWPLNSTKTEFVIICCWAGCCWCDIQIAPGKKLSRPEQNHSSCPNYVRLGESNWICQFEWASKADWVLPVSRRLRSCQQGDKQAFEESSICKQKQRIDQ